MPNTARDHVAPRQKRSEGDIGFGRQDIDRTKGKVEPVRLDQGDQLVRVAMCESIVRFGRSAWNSAIRPETKPSRKNGVPPTRRDPSLPARRRSRLSEARSAAVRIARPWSARIAPADVS